MDPPRPASRPVRSTRASSLHSITASSQRKRGRLSTNGPRPKRRQTARPAPEPTTVGESQQPSGASNTHHVERPSDEPIDPRHIFPFMRLPAELRVHIYRMALHRDTPLLLHLPRPTAGDGESNENKTLESHITDKFPGGSPCIPGEESINTTLLRTCSAIYKEARQILYGDNTFILSLTSGIHTLLRLHQRSRSLIKSVSLTIPNHHDILDNFADVVRLGLRYCWGLKSLTIVLPMHIPEGGYIHATTSIYSNAFHILRWLPKGGKVVLDGSGVSDSIKKVVEEEGRLMKTLDERSYLKRQHQMPERH